jgi:hypothetical protein
MLTSAHHVTSITGDPRYRNMMGNLYSERSRSASPATIATRTQSHTASAGRSRTLAWFIYRKPGGRVALGVQYGHLCGHTTDGYGSRVASGLRDVFPMEETLARVEYLEEAYARLQDGERVTGPASRRYTDALHLFDRQFRGRYLSNKQAAALRVNPQLRIYDNAQQFVTCCYDQAKALCHPDRQSGVMSHSPLCLVHLKIARDGPRLLGFAI